MTPALPRQISADEANLLLRVLERAPLTEVAPAVFAVIPTLTVIGVCGCGCRTIYFRPPGVGDRRIADACAQMPCGTPADVMVWATPEGLAALEIVDYSLCGEFPVADTVCTQDRLVVMFQ